MPSNKKKSKKNKGKFAPLIWILTGAIIAFFISYSKVIKSNFSITTPENKITNTNILNKTNKSINNIISNNQNQNVNINFQDKDKISNENKISVNIYLAKQLNNYIRLIEKRIEITKTENILSETLKELINYRPDESDVYNLVPYKTKINKIWIKDQIAYIDFNEEFSYNSMGVLGYKIQIYQIVYTVVQFKNIKAVYFYMNGKPLEYLGGEGYLIYNPIYPFSTLPKFSL